MPIFEYEHLASGGVGSCALRFEHIHGHGERPFEVCPVCAAAVRLVPSGFAAPEDVLAPSNLKEKGFTKLRRKDKGVYRAE